MRKNKKHNATLEVVRASRKGSRELELETSTGFIATHRTHKSKKTYSRKEKYNKQLV